jgi:hypothetical protein
LAGCLSLLLLILYPDFGIMDDLAAEGILDSKRLVGVYGVACEQAQHKVYISL